MRIGILTDLSSWTTDRLLVELRRQFAYSVGVFVLMIPPLAAAVMIPGDPIPHGLTASGLLFFFGLELCTWFSFIRVWREVRRRIPAK